MVRGGTLVAGRTSACSSCATIASQTTHGMSRTPLYDRWRAMIGRVTQVNGDEYHNYGGRGIKICESWASFENFAADMAPGFSPELELDRRDVNGDYSPENCRWATEREQQRNKRNNHLVTWWGRTQTVQDWAEQLGLKPNTVIHRLRRGWSVDRALTKGADPTVLRAVANSPAPVLLEIANA